MRFSRLYILALVAAITALLFWQANSPVHAKPTAPACGGKDLMAQLQSEDVAAYSKLIERGKRLENGDGLLWRVEKPGLAPSHLFGTIHISDARVASLSPAVKAAIKGSRSVALEVAEVADKKKMEQETIKNIKLIAFLDGRSIENVLSKDEIIKLKGALKTYGIPYPAMRIMKPWFLAITLALPPCELQRAQSGLLAIDEVIATLGKEAGARIVGLESVKEQFAAFDAFTLEEQKLFLMSAVEMLHTLEDQIETMKQLYLRRQLGVMWEFQEYITRKTATSGNLKKELAVLDRFKSLLVQKRNLLMRDRARPLVQKGGAFIAVGALHLPGKTGLVAQLRHQGFTVTKVE